MIIVKDRNLKELGILKNAYNVGVKRTVNEVWQSSFKLPKNDKKNKLCSHFNYIEIISDSKRNYGLYRIVPTKTKKSINTDYIEYKCESVLAILLDDIMEGYHQYTNYKTREVLQFILDLQEVKNIKLGTVEFERRFHYSFENENGLLAPILSIPKPFKENYEFKLDTKSYPWTLDLIESSNEVTSEIRWNKDMIDFEEVSDPTEIVNYIIPLGYGEGVNQLDISSVNNGKRYIKDDASIDKWGKKPYIWIDKRFEDAQSLKESAESLLEQWKDPKISFTCNSIDLSIKPEYKAKRRLLNGVTRIIVEDKVYYARIIEEDIKDISKEYDVNYKISNKLDDIATTQADMERKQQVNEAYSQGATNIINFSYQDNCDENIPALIPFYVDDDVVNINTCELTFRTKKFRAYSQATKGGGATVKSTSSGGGTTKSTTSGGGTSTSTASGGGSTQSSSSGGGTSKSTSSGGATTQSSNSAASHRHLMLVDQGVENVSGTKRMFKGYGPALVNIETSNPGDVYTAGASGSHSHSVSIPSHTHGFSTPDHSHNVGIPSHTHGFTIPNHAHDVTIPAHTHDIDLPDHIHDVKHEIIELSTMPNSVVVKVDGNIVPENATSQDRLDIVDYLSKDTSGNITRGRHTVEIKPNGLARIEADLILRVFIQSRLGGKF